MYENSRFLKNRFTFCGVNTNFGQQWAPPAYYHLTPIVSKGKHCDAFPSLPICLLFAVDMVIFGYLTKQNRPYSATDIYNNLHKEYGKTVGFDLRYDGSCDILLQSSKLKRPLELTHWGLVTPYGDRDLGQHWLRQWLVAWRHQAITWTNVDLSSVRSCDIPLGAISQKISQPSIIVIGLKSTHRKFH